MRTNPADDFGVFAGNEHMFFGLRHPFVLIRTQTEAELGRHTTGTALDALKTFDAPKFLTLGRKTADGSRVLVTHFGVSVRAKLHVARDGGSVREIIDAVLTFLFANVDQLGAERFRTHFDLHAAAEAHFTQDVFYERFLIFRLDTLEESSGNAVPEVFRRRPWWKLWA